MTDFEKRRIEVLKEWLAECDKCEVEQIEAPSWLSYKMKYNV